VEVNGVRKAQSSNSSIIFDREAIEQTQALSLANVMYYLPGQTIVKPVVTVQGNQMLTMRSAFGTNFNSLEALNNAFGISFQLDGNVMSNDANMQMMNPGRDGFFGAHNISNPETATDRGFRNGTMYRSYSNEFQANNGIDMRQIPAENIESIEVISGVASAKYGDYTTGVVNIQRQAGVMPLRINLRTNEATQNIGINKGFALAKGWGALNIGVDHLFGKDDPRNSLKTYRRTSLSILWSYQQNKTARFKNTLSIDASSTLDKTNEDPDLDNQRSARMENKRISISNRASWTYKRNWFYDFQIQGSYSIGKQDSYDQYYLNSGSVKGIPNSLETGIFEGYYVPGYYLATKQIIGEPVNINARAETNSLMKLGKHVTNKISIGMNYSYSANNGAGLIMDPERPRFANSGNKSDRPRPFKQVPTVSNAGIYLENAFKARIAQRPLSVNVGVRGDLQNDFFTVSPRVNTRYSIAKNLSWNAAFGVATKAPSLSQISPGNVYIDVPLIPNAYNGSVNESVFLVYTKVIELNKLDIKPYRSNTFETGFTYDHNQFHFSAYYFYRENRNGFLTQNTLLPLTLPLYQVVPVPGQKPSYAPIGRDSIFNVTYNKMTNGLDNTTNGIEFSMSVDKIRSIQTSFNFNTAIYYTRNSNKNTTVNTEKPRYDQTALYGVFGPTTSKLTNVKSTITTSTHIPALRMALVMTGELFWVNNTYTEEKSFYPVGYFTKDMQYFSLSPEQARLPEYAHLKKATADGNSLSLDPSFLYPNIHMRLSKEIGDYMRFSFNAYNVFNIRPSYQKASGTNYYNGQPSYGAEIIFTIK